MYLIISSKFFKKDINLTTGLDIEREWIKFNDYVL